LIRMINRSHQSDRVRARLRREAAVLFRALRRAEIVQWVRDPDSGRATVRVSDQLQFDFSLHQVLSLYLIEVLTVLDPGTPSYTLELLSVIESILENPRVILARQLDRIKRDLITRLKAEGVPYEERIRELEEVSYPKPEADFIYQTFALFSEKHPWVGVENIRPKSIAREMFERYATFDEYVRDYGLARSEGILLRYLGQVYDTLVRSVPESARMEGVWDVIAFFRSLIAGVDSSLLAEWESRMHEEAPPVKTSAERTAEPFDLAHQPRLLFSQVRAELHRLVKLLSSHDYEGAARAVCRDPDHVWEAARFAEALQPYFEEYEEIVFTPKARENRNTRIESKGERFWQIEQALIDPQGDNLWCVFCEVDLRRETDPTGPLLRVVRIGT